MFAGCPGALQGVLGLSGFRGIAEEEPTYLSLLGIEPQ